jgi:flagellar biosynthetic protein FliP
MAFNMTVPMVWWMQHRGHGFARSAEMAGAMIVPTLVTVDLYWVGLLAGDAVLALQHAIMIPAMVAVMLWRREHYSGRH